jgi:hypothetical protein
MGIRAGGGYTANPAINDCGIKAVGTVSGVNIGSMFRNGWDNNVKSPDAIPALENGLQSKNHLSQWGCNRNRAVGAAAQGSCV